MKTKLQSMFVAALTLAASTQKFWQQICAHEHDFYPQHS